MIRPLRALFGYVRLRFAAERAAEAVAICGAHGLVYWDVRFHGEWATLCTSLVSWRRMKGIRDLPQGLWEVERVCGLPAILYRYRHRYGLAVGGLACTLLLALSGLVVWDVRVEGNERLSDGEVIACLQECGLQRGSLRSHLDIDRLENRVLIRSEEISWISVNLIGTVAQVEIRERETWAEEEEEEPIVASNLVAARDGQIELFVDVRGNVVRRIGDVVRQGELLVSGIYDSATVGMRLTRCHGQVIARTEHLFSAQVPYTYERKEYTGRVLTEKYLIFFEKEVKIFSNIGKKPSEYDIIERVTYGETFTGDLLPVGVRTVEYLEYTYKTCRRTEEEALSLARYRLRCEAEQVLRTGELLRESTQQVREEDGVRLTLSVEILENIALERRIEVDLPSGAGWSRDGTENRQN